MGMLGKVAKQIEVQKLFKTYYVNVADGWRERLRSYPGRAHGHAKM